MPTRPTLSVDQVTPSQAGWDATVNNATGQLKTFVADQPFAPTVFTVASGAGQLPAAASYQWCLAIVSDATSGKAAIVFSDGVNWRYTDNTVAL